MSKLNLIMPMAGGGTRFFNDGFEVPKPLIKIYDKPFFYWAVQSIKKFVELESLSFVVLKEHIEKFNIDKEILKYYPLANINVIDKILDGAVLTCMQGVKNINKSQPILFNDCDHLFISNSFNNFCKNKKFNDIDAALLTFKSNNPAYSYLSFDENSYVNKTVEKEVISDCAICGAYYFKNKEIFEEAVKKYLDNCAYQEYFVSGVYNILADENKKIINFDTDVHISFGTPKEYEIAKDDNTYKELI